MSDPQFPLSVLDAIHHRCSVRDYAPEKPKAEILHRLLGAAVRAPTAMHTEPWAFLVVQDAALLNRLSDCAKAEFSNAAQHMPEGQTTDARALLAQPHFNIFYNATTLIVICAHVSSPFVTADCWLAAQNLMLAAYAEGLGTCVVGFAVGALNTATMKSELGIPPDMVAVAPIILGVPRGGTPVTSRKPPRILRYL